MNERIRELRERAFDWVQNQLHTLGSDHQVTQDQQLQMVNEKFAELIVRECVQQLELVRKYRYDRVQPLENQQTIIDECQYQIKEHFGVEK